MRAFAAGFRLELRIMRTLPDALIPLVTAPLFTIIFLTIVRNAGRHDLQADALIAPLLMTLWWFALFQGGTIVTADRGEGVLDSVLATPSSLDSILLGRIAAIMVCSFVGLLEILAVAELLFGVPVPLEHPAALALTLAATVLAMAATTVLFCALFLVARSAYTFANSASFPFYVLGGVFVPVAVLPGWIEPVSSAIFISWSADLLRAALRPAAIEEFWPRLGMVLVLGAASFAVGRAAIFRALRRLRTTGELTMA